MGESPEPTRFYVVHMMKTGGTTLTWHARATYGLEGVYPYEQLGDGPYLVAYTSVSHIVERVTARIDDVRVVFTHAPLYVASLLPGEWKTITVLREPVARVCSALRAQHRGPGPCEGLGAEAIYERYDFRHTADNHQVKMMAARDSDGFDVPLTAALTVDEERVRAAKSALETIDYVALHETYDAMLARLAAEHGWRTGLAADQNLGTPLDIPDSLLARIASDNEGDAELVAHARSLLGI